MKHTYRIVFSVIVLASLLLSACGASATQPTGAPKVEADLIVTGLVESMHGTQWVVNGRTFTVDPSVVRDGPFTVGDSVKVEGNVQSDGTVLVTRVELPSADDLATANDNSNDVNSNVNDDNSNDVNSNDDNGNDVNSNDDNGNDVNSNDDNSNDSNSNDDNGNDDNSNDNNSNDDNGNDDNANDDNSNSNDSNDNSDDVNNSNDDNSNG